MRVFPIPRTSELGPFAALLVTLVAMLLLSPFVSESILGISRFRFLTATRCSPESTPSATGDGPSARPSRSPCRS